MTRLMIIGLAGAVIALTGCQTYKSQPLTSDAVQQALTPPSDSVLRIAAQQLNHPILRPVELDFHGGLSPDAAAVLAALLNPGLRALRDQRGLADSQLLQAGLLPNPQISYNLDKPAFGSTDGTVTAYGFGLSWDTQQWIIFYYSEYHEMEGDLAPHERLIQAGQNRMRPIAMTTLAIAIISGLVVQLPLVLTVLPLLLKLLGCARVNDA